jgi:hypothetical protein
MFKWCEKCVLADSSLRMAWVMRNWADSLAAGLDVQRVVGIDCGNSVNSGLINPGPWVMN